MMWFDYKKAFDSILHQWLIEALKLAKIPDMLLNAIVKLTEKWATNNTVSITDTIRYLTGVLQGDYCHCYYLYYALIHYHTF